MYNKTVLSNGIRIFTEHVSTVHSVALGFFMLTGSKDETPETNGLAHLFEHLSFKQTTNRNNFQIAHDIESLGGSINAYTTKNVTCYYVRLMSEHLEKGIEVLSDLILNPAFTEKHLAHEKGVVIEEIKDVEDTPSDIIYDYFTEQMFPDHPFGRSIQGTAETVNSITRAQVFDFVQKKYNTNRLIISAAGNLEHEKVVAMVEKYLNGLQPGEPANDFPTLLPWREKQKVFPKPIQQAHVLIGRRIFPQTDERRHHLALLNILLSGGMTSRLFHNIREKFGFVYSIYSGFEYNLCQGIFYLYVATDPKKLDKVSQLVYAEIEKTARRKVPVSEFEKLKVQFKGGMVIGLESMQSRMSRMAKMEIFEKRFIGLEEYLQIIEAITPQDLKNLGEYLYDKESFIETIILPETKA